MTELQAGAWLLENHGDSKSCYSIQKCWRTPVNHVLTCVLCFVSQVSVPSLIHPNQVPELMAYISTIMRCQKELKVSGRCNMTKYSGARLAFKSARLILHCILLAFASYTRLTSKMHSCKVQANKLTHPTYDSF